MDDTYDGPTPPPWDDIDDATERQLAFNRDVASELARMRVRHAARERFDRERHEALALPALQRLDEFLAVPDAPLTHRIRGLWPVGGRVVLSAPHKAGKSTTAGNILRSLVDGADFLGAFKVEPIERVLLLDNELDEDMLRRWLREQGILAGTAVELVPMRGKLSTFNILDPDTRARWAAHLGPADALVLDCLRPALDALGLSEDKEAGRFLEALDEMASEAGIRELLVVHHMGHSSERSRGDSRILDWPDAVWKLVRDADDEDETRRVYFSAYGRDVDQPETLLAFDPTTRHLSIAGGSRAQTRAEVFVDDVLEFVTEHPGCSKNAIEKGIEGRAELIRKALQLLVRDGRLNVEKRGTAHCHWAVSSTSSDLVPDEGTNSPRDLVPSSIDEGRGRGAGRRPTQEQLVPDEVTCPDCSRRLSRSEKSEGVCIQCRRIRAAS